MAHHCFSFKAMGTRCEIRLFAHDAAIAANAIGVAAGEINRLEQKYSRYLPNNFLAHINRAAQHGSSTAIDAECAALLQFSDACHRQSDGLFDITSGVLRRAWNFDRQVLPDEGLLAQLLSSVGWQHVRWSAELIRFQRPGMEIDFGGIVKEYAADRAAAVLRESGIVHGMVDMGGDIVAVGPDPDGLPWQISIRHPRREDTVVATFALTHGAVATSGDYARCVIVDGRRYSHLLSPFTGWPVQGLASVSAVCDQCVVAGGVSTTAILMEGNGRQWLEDGGMPHVWVDLDGQIGGSAATIEAAP